MPTGLCTTQQLCFASFSDSVVATAQLLSQPEVSLAGCDLLWRSAPEYLRHKPAHSAPELCPGQQQGRSTASGALAGWTQQSCPSPVHRAGHHCLSKSASSCLQVLLLPPHPCSLCKDLLPGHHSQVFSGKLPSEMEDDSKEVSTPAERQEGSQEPGSSTSNEAALL